MSKVQLGTIQFSVPSTKGNWYVGGIVNSESGFMVPKVITNASYYELIYGKFKYKDMYEKLITEHQLPAAILPILTPKSKYNRTSLRLFNKDNVQYHAYPRYDLEYSNETEVGFNADTNQIELGNETYSMMIDLSSASWTEGGSKYFILKIGSDRYCFSLINSTYPTTEYWDIHEVINSESDLIAKLNSISGISSIITSTSEYSAIVTNSWNKCFDSNEVDMDPNNELGLENYELFIETLYSYESFTINTEDIVKLVKDHTFTASTQLSDILIADIPDTNKILVKYDDLSINMNFYDWEGLKLLTEFNVDQDELCSRLDNYKVIDVYSKIKGPAGENIEITINKSMYDGAYEFNIELGTLSESFICYLVKNDLMPEDIIDIRLLGRYSELVEVKIYDYELPDGTVIDQLDYLDKFGDYSSFDPDRVIDINIPLGTYKLRRLDPEVIDKTSYQYSLKVYSESKTYPDLFLVPELFYEDQTKDVMSLVRGSEPYTVGYCTKGIYSQALLTVSKEYINVPLINSYNRMLYFYDDIEIKGIKYPTFYPYINQIITGTVLRLPPDNLCVNYDEYIVGNAVECSGVVLEGYQMLAPPLPPTDPMYPSGITVNNGAVTIVIDSQESGESVISPYTDDESGLIYLNNGDIAVDPEVIETNEDTGLVLGWNTSPLATLGIGIISAVITYYVLELDGYINSDGDNTALSDEVIGDIVVNNYVTAPDGNIYKILSISERTRIRLEGSPSEMDPSQLTPITEYLNKQSINYLKYNNLYYYYPNLYEYNDQKNLFLAQFDCSKVSRAFFDWGTDLLSSNESTYSSRVGNIITRLQSCLPYLSSITYESNIDNNLLKITTTVEMRRLVNKVFNINFLINLN